MFRPSIFIGSSTEGLAVAQAIRAQLKDEAEITIWNEGVFGLGTGTLESLVSALDGFDFAILVLTPDDMVESRKQVSQSPRDNVLLECGMFIGRLGRFRTFVVYDKDQEIKIPSDFAGVTLTPYKGNRQDGNLIAALGEACNPIREKIKNCGFLPSRKISGIEISAQPFKEVFGKDVFFSGAFYLCYSKFTLLQIINPTNGSIITHPYIKAGEENIQGRFSIERPVSSCEVRAAKYLDRWQQTCEKLL